MGLAGFYFGIVNSYIHLSTYFFYMLFYLDLLFVKQLRLVLTLEFSCLLVMECWDYRHTLHICQ